MAADANLIKSAATAYGAGTAAKQAGGNALGAAAQGFVNRVDAQTAELKKDTEEAKKRDLEFSDKFAENSEAASLQAGALGEEEYDVTQKRIAGLKKQYDELKIGDDAGRQKLLGQLARESQGLNSQKEARVLNAKALKTLRTDVSREDRHIMGSFANSNSGAYTIDEDASGELTYTFTMPEGSKDSEGRSITEKKMTAAEVQKLYEMQTDDVGAQATKDKALVNIAAGENGEEFDEANNGAAFDDLVTTDASFMSALHDDWGVGSFSASIDDKITNEIQALNSAGQELDMGGVTMPLEEGETNWYDNISMKDAGEIKRRLMNPSTPEEKEISKTVLKEYYVDAQRQQHARGVKKAKDASLAAQKKILDKENFEILKGEIKSKIQAENNAAKRGIVIEKAIIANSQVDTKTNVKSGNIPIPNENPDKATDGTENQISISVEVAKDLGNKIEDKSFTGGFTGQQMNRYYYKTNDGNFKQFKSKKDFIDKNDLNAAIEKAGPIDQKDSGGRIVYNEEQEQIIANFKAAPGGINGGNPISISTLRTEEGIDAAQNEVVEEKTSNPYLDKIQEKRESVRARQIREANKNKTTGGGVVRE